MAATLRLSTSMLRPNWSTTPAKDARVSALPEDSEISEDAAGSGMVDTGVEDPPEVCGGVDIIPRIPDTKLLESLVLRERDHRLYV